MDISFEITNQQLKRTDKNFIVEDSMQYLYANFTFSEDWEDVTKSIFFSKNGTEWIKVILSSTETRCVVPFEVIKAPDFMVYAVGNNGSKVITTNILKYIHVQKTGNQNGELGGIGEIPLPEDINFIKQLTSSDSSITVTDSGNYVYDLIVANIFGRKLKITNEKLQILGKPITVVDEDGVSQQQDVVLDEVDLITPNNVKSLSYIDGKLKITFNDDTFKEAEIDTGKVEDVVYNEETKELTISYLDDTKEDLVVPVGASNNVKEMTYVDNKLKITFDDDTYKEVEIKSGNNVKSMTYINNMLRITFNDDTYKEVEIESGGSVDFATVEEAKKYLGIGVE